VNHVVCFLLGNSPALRNTQSHLHRQVGKFIYILAYEDGTECSETSAYKIQTPGNFPEETYNIQNTAKV